MVGVVVVVVVVVVGVLVTGWLGEGRKKSGAMVWKW